MITTESCESLNEISLVGRDAKSRDSCSRLGTLFFGRVWSLLAVPRKSLKPLALACEPTRDKVVDEPNIQKWKMRCEHCNSR